MGTKRTWRTEIRFTYDEYEKLKKKSKKTGLPQSTLIRVLLDGYEPQARLDDEFYIKIDELRKATEKLQNYARIGLLRGWLDMEIYSQVYKDTAMLILDLKREYLLPKKMNNKDLKLLEKINKNIKK